MSSRTPDSILLGWLLVSGILFGGCLKPSVDPLDFFNVQTGDASIITLDTFSARGTIAEAGLSVLDSCGFVWSTDLAAIGNPEMLQSVVYCSPPPQGNGDFSGALPTAPDATVYYRAFGRLGDRKVFSETVRSFSLGAIVSLVGTVVVENNEALLFGQMTGLEQYGINLDFHGHVYSATMALPEIGAPGCDTTQLGAINNDVIFSSRATELDLNTTYYVRAYAIKNQKPFYSSRADTFRVRDGWVRVNNFPVGYHNGTCASSEALQTAFAGFGCGIESDCLKADLKKDNWRFDLASESWQPNSDPPVSFIPRLRVDAAVIGNQLYVLDGEFSESGSTFLTFNFFSFDLSNQIWKKLPAPPGTMPLRTRAVSFVLQDRLYVGTGLNVDGNQQETWLSDFWEYNPVIEQWRQVASMPQAREDAEVFVFDQFAVVGGGSTGVKYLNDFYKFIPPAPGSSEPGVWEQVASFPGPARILATGLSIDGVGYYGTGVDYGEYYFDDWWAYDPITNTWSARTPFQGGKRVGTMGYALNGKGYLGTGLKRVVEPNGNNVTNELQNDFWKYIPRKD